MSDTPFSDDALDVVASAYVDGEADAAERARVEGDADLQRRVESMRTIRTIVSAIEPAPADQRDHTLRAALAVFDAQRAGSDPAPAIEPVAAAALAPRPAPVLSLDAARARRVRRLAPVLGIAAASVLVLGAGLMVANRGDDTGGNATAELATTLAGDDGQRKEAPADRDAGTDATGDATPTVAPAMTQPTASPTPMVAADEMIAAGAEEAGDTFATQAAPSATIDDVWALVTEQAARVAAGDTAARTTTMCPEQTGDPAADVTWEGVPAVVYVVPSLADPQTAVVLDSATCTVLANLPAA